MILLLDAGNSRLKWAWWSPASGLQPGGACAYTDLSRFLGRQSAQAHGCNVAGAAAAAVVESVVGPVNWVRPGSRALGLENLYAAPDRLGADRWAAAVAAWQRVGDDCLVVSAGTALTVDVVLRQGPGGRASESGAVYRGGLIVPGFDLMRASLAGGTAQLPLAEGQVVCWPDNTQDAIVTGCIQAQVGAVQRMYQSLPRPGTRVVLTGGAGGLLRPHFDFTGDGTVDVAESLVLEGVAALAGCVAPARAISA